MTKPIGRTPDPQTPCRRLACIPAIIADPRDMTWAGGRLVHTAFQNGPTLPGLDGLQGEGILSLTPALKVSERITLAMSGAVFFRGSFKERGGSGLMAMQNQDFRFHMQINYRWGATEHHYVSLTGEHNSNHIGDGSKVDWSELESRGKVREELRLRAGLPLYSAPDGSGVFLHGGIVYPLFGTVPENEWGRYQAAVEGEKRLNPSVAFIVGAFAELNPKALDRTQLNVAAGMSVGPKLLFDVRVTKGAAPDRLIPWELKPLELSLGIRFRNILPVR